MSTGDWLVYNPLLSTHTGCTKGQGPWGETNRAIYLEALRDAGGLVGAGVRGAAQRDLHAAQRTRAQAQHLRQNRTHQTCASTSHMSGDVVAQVCLLVPQDLFTNPFLQGLPSPETLHI